MYICDACHPKCLIACTLLFDQTACCEFPEWTIREQSYHQRILTGVPLHAQGVWFQNHPLLPGRLRIPSGKALVIGVWWNSEPSGQQQVAQSHSAVQWVFRLSVLVEDTKPLSSENYLDQDAAVTVKILCDQAMNKAVAVAGTDLLFMRLC